MPARGKCATALFNYCSSLKYYNIDSIVRQIDTVNKREGRYFHTTFQLNGFEIYSENRHHYRFIVKN